jgi:flavodoxin
MNVLIMYYSRTGKTRKIAEKIKEKLSAEVDEIKDIINRNGFLGWLSAGRDAVGKKLTEIKNVDKNPADYNVVILGSPTWNNSLSTPIRTYIDKYGESLKHVAIFSTSDGDDQGALEEMDKMLGKKVFARMNLIRKQEIDSDLYHEKIENFVELVNSFMR